jgi:hypothetical protein
LQGLKLLKYLNLSYNGIESLQGFHVFHGTELAHLDIHGNNIKNMEDFSVLKGCLVIVHLIKKLIELVVSEDDEDPMFNPVRTSPGIHGTLFSMIPQLRAIDRADRLGSASN